MKAFIITLMLIPFGALGYYANAETGSAQDNPQESAKSNAEPRATATENEFTVESKNATLKVRIQFPKGVEKPCPAIVIVHGSGRVTRNANQGLQRFLMRMGFAIVSYDKRGVGDSTGRYTGIGVRNGVKELDLLAQDAAAVHEWMKQQDGVDPERVGFFGGSQAGWIMPQAINHAKNAAFMVAMSGPTVSVGEENYYSRLTNDDSNSKATIDNANESTRNYSGPRGYDPRSVVESNSTPSFWLFGEMDESLPAALCIEELKKVIDGGNESHAFYAIPGANHNLRDAKTGKEFPIGNVVKEWFIEQGILK